MLSASEVVERLGLVPLSDEGGFYRETYRCDNSIGSGDRERNIATAIYYLITQESFSALHRVTSDEIFHFYAGEPVELLQIDFGGVAASCLLGNRLEDSMAPQVLVRAGNWQGLRLTEKGQWALLGTTVSPGFDFRDFELGQRDSLIREFPHLENQIRMFTRS